MKNVALLFPGGGTQYVGMGKYFYSKYPFVEQIFEEASEALSISMQKLCFDSDNKMLSKMENAQPATLLVSYVGFKVFQYEYDLAITCCSGHSLGEYTALACSGAIRFDDALKLIRKRGQLLQQVGNQVNGTMMAVNKLPGRQVRDMIRAHNLTNTYVAVCNSPFQYVLSGERKKLEYLGNLLSRKGAQINVLNINTTSHCPLMIDAANELRLELESCEFSDPKWPVISNLNGEPYLGRHQVADTLYKNMTNPVLWQLCLEKIAGYNIDYWIDAGPLSINKNLLPHIFEDQNINSYAIDNEEDRKGLDIELKPNYKGVIASFLAIAASTPNCNEGLCEDMYTEMVIQPYEKLLQLKTEMHLGYDKLSFAMDCIQSILDTKAVPIGEKTRRLEFALTKNNISNL